MRLKYNDRWLFISRNVSEIIENDHPIRGEKGKSVQMSVHNGFEPVHDVITCKYGKFSAVTPYRYDQRSFQMITACFPIVRALYEIFHKSEN